MRKVAELNTWILPDAVALCKAIERVCPQFGCHIALTGGVIYRTGPRKDVDIILYRIRQSERIDFDGLWKALIGVGVTYPIGGGWIYKATFNGKRIDFLIPEEQGDEEYPEEELNAETEMIPI